MTSSDICNVLRERYKQPEWALFFEVGSGTGANCKRHADALTMNMYPSRGLTILGFEIKVSRSDLKRELDNPNKAEEIARYCNEWWLVVPNGLIRDDDNIPRTWGVMECKDNKISITKKALSLEPKPVTKEFMAAVLRSAGKIDEDTLRQERNKAYLECRKNYDEQLSRELELRMRRFDKIRENVDRFEKVTGKKIDQYTDGENLAKNIKLAENIEMLYSKYGSLQSIRRLMESFIDKTKEVERLGG